MLRRPASGVPCRSHLRIRCDSAVGEVPFSVGQLIVRRAATIVTTSVSVPSSYLDGSKRFFVSHDSRFFWLDHPQFDSQILTVFIPASASARVV